jgi:hypothetical protein
LDLKPLFPDPKTPEEFVALLPARLRAFLEREIAAGNEIGETGTGFPAPPVGVWIKMKKGFMTGKEKLPEGVLYRQGRPGEFPAECRDARAHFFVIGGPEPVSQDKSQVNEAAPVVSGYDWQEKAEAYARDQHVGEAIGKHLGLSWDAQTDEAILAEVGEEGLRRAKEIDAYAQRAEFWTREQDNMRGYQRMQRELADKFPFLPQKAVTKLATRAAWSWR